MCHDAALDCWVGVWRFLGIPRGFGRYLSFLFTIRIQRNIDCMPLIRLLVLQLCPFSYGKSSQGHLKRSLKMPGSTSRVVIFSFLHVSIEGSI